MIEKLLNRLGYVKKDKNLLPKSMEALDDYLNAGFKEERHRTSIKAQKVYKDYHGFEYQNRKDRK